MKHQISPTRRGKRVPWIPTETMPVLVIETPIPDPPSNPPNGGTTAPPQEEGGEEP